MEYLPVIISWINNSITKFSHRKQTSCNGVIKNSRTKLTIWNKLPNLTHTFYKGSTIRTEMPVVETLD